MADPPVQAVNLVDYGVEVLGPVDHGFAHSIYFFDPNGVRLELTAQLADDGVERLPAARRPPRAAVDDEVVGVLGHVGIEVVHQHPHRGFLVPAQAGDGGAGGRGNGFRMSEGSHGSKASLLSESLQPFGPSDDPIPPR